MATPGKSNCRLPDRAKLPVGSLHLEAVRRGQAHTIAPRGDYLDACHAARVERDQPVAVAAAEDPGLLAAAPR